MGPGGPTPPDDGPTQGALGSGPPSGQAFAPNPPAVAGTVTAGPARRTQVEAAERGDEGVESNRRLTAMTAAVLLVLLAVEGLTILRISVLLVPHVLIGMLLVPPILLKIGSTGWRFARYYLGSPAYRRKGPPPTLLRLLGPIVVGMTAAVMGTGIALLLAPPHLRGELLFLHKASFVAWFAVMAVHVTGHLVDTTRLAPRDFDWRTQHRARGAGIRQLAIAVAICLGLALAVVTAPKAGSWAPSGRSAVSTVSTRPR